MRALVKPQLKKLTDIFMKVCMHKQVSFLNNFKVPSLSCTPSFYTHLFILPSPHKKPKGKGRRGGGGWGGRERSIHKLFKEIDLPFGFGFVSMHFLALQNSKRLL